MPRVAALLATAVLAATAACSGSAEPATTSVTVSGVVLGVDGRPLAGAQVVLLSEAGLAGAPEAADLFTGTVGLACLGERAPKDCDGAGRAMTGDDGSYRLRLPATDGRAASASSTMFLSAAAPGTPYSVSARFQAHQAAVDLPPLRMWAPQPKVTAGRVARAEWSPLDGSRSERMVFTDGPAGGITWIAEARTPMSIDGRILEDSRGQAAAEATTSEDVKGSSFRMTHRSPEVPFAATAGPAPSRNAACTPAPCALTDGVFTPPETPPPPTREFLIDLGVNRTAALVVVRGCPAVCNVETSLNRVDWTVVGSGDRPFFSITPVSGPPVHFVRVTASSDISRLSEVSVWER